MSNERKPSPYKDKNGNQIFEGDTVKGVGKYIGESEVFFKHDAWQPFTYLNDFDGNNYEIVPKTYIIDEKTLWQIVVDANFAKTPVEYFTKLKTNNTLQQFTAKEVPVQGEWQLCPKCNGQGITSKPPYIPGDVYEWTSTSGAHQCDVCKGNKIIQRPLPVAALPDWTCKCETSNDFTLFAGYSYCNKCGKKC